MCGRFYLDADFEELLRRYGLFESGISYEPAGEVFPSERAVAVLSDGRRHLKRLKWGFTPSFSKRPIINARSETAFEKTLFRRAALERRCLIPARGWFEWEQTDEGKKKRFIRAKNGELLSLGGLYGTFPDKAGNQQLSFTILTREAVMGLDRIHSRMPVVIQPDNEALWLDPAEKRMPVLASIMNQLDLDLTTEEEEKA